MALILDVKERKGLVRSNVPASNATGASSTFGFGSDDDLLLEPIRELLLALIRLHVRSIDESSNTHGT